VDPVLVVITYGAFCTADGPGNGLRDLADAIRQKFPAAHMQVITRTYAKDDSIEQKVQNHRGPVVLVGHSFGGWRSFEIARRVTRTIDFLILLDPVPYNAWTAGKPSEYFRLPPTVRNGICYHRPDSAWSATYSITNPKNPTDNRPRDISHSAFCASPEVHRYVMAACAVASPARTTPTTAFASN